MRDRPAINSLLYKSKQDIAVVNLYWMIIPETKCTKEKYVSLLQIFVEWVVSTYWAIKSVNISYDKIGKVKSVMESTASKGNLHTLVLWMLLAIPNCLYHLENMNVSSYC